MVDVLRKPERALKDGILVTPTLVISPLPVQSIIGDLSEEAAVLTARAIFQSSEEQ